MNTQLPMLYRVDRSKVVSKSKTTTKMMIDDVCIQRTIEDILLTTGLDIGEEPESYIYADIGGKKLLIFCKNKKPINTYKEVDPKHINILKFFTTSIIKSITHNFNNKRKISGFDVDTIVYYAKLLGIGKIDSFAKIVSLITITKFPSYVKKLDRQKSVYNSMYDILMNGRISNGYSDFTKHLVGFDVFVCGCNDFLEEYRALCKRHIPDIPAVKHQ